jgi:hypothetical protein
MIYGRTIFYRSDKYENRFTKVDHRRAETNTEHTKIGDRQTRVTNISGA